MKFLLLVFVVVSTTCCCVASYTCVRGPRARIVALNQTCVQFIGSNTLDHCLPIGPTGATGAVGATGAIGATGATGETGPTPTTVPLSSSCVQIGDSASACALKGPKGDTGDDAVVVQVNETCLSLDGTIHCGYAGPQGPPGDTGTVGAAATVVPVNASCALVGGSTTVCMRTGDTGANGPIPGYWVVDGVTYAQTRAGVQAAIDAASAAGGGVVQLASDITIDDTSLFMKPNVVLDGREGRRFSLKAPATAQSLAIITNSGLSGGSTVALEVNATRGSMNITVPSSIAASFVAAAGQSVFANFVGCMIDDLPDTITERISTVHKVCGVDTVTSTIILCWPLTYDCRLDLSATVQRVVSTIRNVGIRHLTLDVNGNTGIGTRLIYANYWDGGFWEDIIYTGDWSNAVSGSFAMVVNVWHGGIIDNIRTGTTFKQYLETRDMSLRYLEATTVSNIRSSRTGGFGPNIDFSHNVVFRNYYSNRQDARGFRIDSSSNVIALGLNSCGHVSTRGSGMWFAYGSHQNSVIGYNSIGNSAYSLSQYTTGDSNNVVLGMQSYAVFGTGDIGPNIDRYGTMIMASKMNYDSQFASIGQMIQGSRFNSGHSQFSLNEAAIPTTADMQFNGALSFSAINETHVGLNVRTRAGVMRRQVLELTAY